MQSFVCFGVPRFAQLNEFFHHNLILPRSDYRFVYTGSVAAQRTTCSGDARGNAPPHPVGTNLNSTSIISVAQHFL